MKPKEILGKWIDCFNKADAFHLAELYATDAVSLFTELMPRNISNL